MNVRALARLIDGRPRAANGDSVAPPSKVMNSRRRMSCPRSKARSLPHHCTMRALYLAANIPAYVGWGSIASFSSSADYFRSSPGNGHRQGRSPCLKGAKRGSGPPDSIISSTCARSVGGIVMPSDHCTAPMPTAPIQKPSPPQAREAACASRADDDRHFTGGRPATAASVGLFRHFGWPNPLAL
jgi:hypothetical protein